MNKAAKGETPTLMASVWIQCRRVFFARNLLVNCVVWIWGCFPLCGSSIRAIDPLAIIRHIGVIDSRHGLEVKISATAAITPLTQFAIKPDRLIVDFQGSQPIAGLHKMLVNNGNLIDVRVGLLSVNPHVTRVVLDLASPARFRVVKSGSVVVIKLDEEPSGKVTPKSAAIAINEPDVEAQPASAKPVIADVLSVSSPQRSRARWIPPILTTASVLAMLVIALVSHIQNKRYRRGI